jgi:hypothetical protein
LLLNVGQLNLKGRKKTLLVSLDKLIAFLYSLSGRRIFWRGYYFPHAQPLGSETGFCRVRSVRNVRCVRTRNVTNKFAFNLNLSF